MKLFAIYVGGAHERANIELHDMRFVAAERIEDTYDTLRRDWWGKPGSLHLDAWVELTHVDGFDVTLRPEPFAGPEKLFYVNLGGYDGSFMENHRNIFVVADSKDVAKKKALALGKGLDDLHRDDQYDIDDVLCLSESAGPLHIHLQPADRVQSLPVLRPDRFFCL